MKFTSLFKVTITTTSAARRWRSCTTATPKTLSFRATTTADSFMTFFEHRDEEIATLESEESAVVSGVRSERLLFEPGETNSILEEAKRGQEEKVVSKEAVVMDSFDPVLDFRASMEEMVAAHGGRKDWDFLEELLTSFLQVNERRNRCYIVEAFADLLIHFSVSNLTNRRRSFTSPLSFTSTATASPSLSLPEKEKTGAS